jgi:hypothetical protein
MKQRWAILAALGVMPLVDCSPTKVPVEPSLGITSVPSFDEGSSLRMETIQGWARGVEAGQQIVLYARAGVWWVQPFADHPFTVVHPNTAWSNRTHPGSAYAALLVKAGYHPLAKTELLPEKGGAILAVAIVEGPKIKRQDRKTLLFDGYEWQVRQTSSDPGGTPNDYDPANATVDEKGFLHMRIAGSPEHWSSAEVSLRRSVGYGTYRFVVRGVSQLEPAAVFSMFTWDDDGPSREMDIEMSRWGQTGSDNGQFVIQPYYLPANTVRFQAPPGVATFMLRWEAGRAQFRAFRGAVSSWETQPIANHTFTSGVPSAGNESVHLNLYVFANKENPLRRGAEVIVETFEYLP